MSDQNDKDIETISIEEELKLSYLDYAMSVIVGRALPDVRDGLKPVHRRVLFAMSELNNSYNRPHVKSASVVGEVIGKYQNKKHYTHTYIHTCTGRSHNNSLR